MPPRIHAAVLQYLDEVARAGSIRSGSARLNVASSAISRQILKLEATLGTPIFDRQPNGLRLTQAGEVLLRHVRSTLSDFDRVKGEIDALKGVKSGLVKIVSLDSLMVHFLPEAISRFHAMHPAVTFRIDSAGPGEIASRVANGDADLGFSFDLDTHAGVELVADIETPMHAMMAARHTLTGRTQLTLQECADFPLLFQEDTRPIQALMDAELRAAGAARQPFLTSNNIALTKQIIRHGLGIAYYTRLGFTNELRDGDIVAVPLVEERLAKLRLGIILPKLRKPTVAVAAVVDHLRSALLEWPEATDQDRPEKSRNA